MEQQQTMKSISTTEKNILFYKSVKRCIYFHIIHPRKLFLMRRHTDSAVQRAPLQELSRTIDLYSLAISLLAERVQKHIVRRTVEI